MNYVFTNNSFNPFDTEQLSQIFPGRPVQWERTMDSGRPGFQSGSTTFQFGDYNWTSCSKIYLSLSFIIWQIKITIPTLYNGCKD